jgi:glucosamine-6-phosphate deaminase
MELIIRPDKDAAALLVARIVASEVRANPRAVLGLATGSTMEAVYRHLVRMHLEAKLNFSGVRTFNLDEYVGLDSAHERAPVQAREH